MAPLVERRVERAWLAKVGALVFAVVLAASASPALARPVLVADAAELLPMSSEITTFTFRLTLVELPEVTGVAQRALPPIEEELGEPEIAGVVIASWYGPGFFGGRTACGQTFSEDVVGVAHRTLPCGTFVQITSPAGITITAPVIDRGPFVAGRSLDLSSALKRALSCSDLCSVRMAVLAR